MDKLAFGAPVGSLMQVAFVVDDIERAMEHWIRTRRVGPFFYMPHFPLFGATFRGEPTAPDIDIAQAFSGTTCFELIHQNDTAPSPFREVSATRCAEVHHTAIGTRSFDADLEARAKQGMTCIATASVGLGRTAYLETNSEFGSLLELIEMTPASEHFFAMLHAAAQDWDGSEPVRRVSLTG